MPTTYRKADHLQIMLQRVIAKYHPDLKKFSVTFDILTAHGDPDSDKPVLTNHGYPAAAVVRINKLADRVDGHADCRLVIDGDRFETFTDAEQVSLLDHEASHILPVIFESGEEAGAVKTDDCGRPKLRMRKHDFQLGLFKDVMQRHGIHSVDLKAAEPLYQFIQQLLPFERRETA